VTSGRVAPVELNRTLAIAGSLAAKKIVPPSSGTLPTHTPLFVTLLVGTVILVVAGISWFAVAMLRDLADEQGKARVQLAGAIAREDLRRMGEDALSAARILAERPALVRLLAEARFEAVPPLLRRFCETDTIDACAVLALSFNAFE